MTKKLRFLVGPRKMGFTIGKTFDIAEMETVDHAGEPIVHGVYKTERIRTNYGFMLKLWLTKNLDDPKVELLTMVSIPRTRAYFYVFRGDVWAWATRSSGSDGQTQGWGQYKGGTGRTTIAIYRVATKDNSPLLFQMRAMVD